MGKIGIMGGTFDPIHNGHLMLGKQAYKEYGLDEVWYMPSGHPPHKKDHEVTKPAMRLEMTKLAVKGHEGFLCSDFEVKRSGNTYTAQTLYLLRKQYPEHVFYFIIGADSLYEIETWYEPEHVMAQTIILAARRKYEEMGKEQAMNRQIAYLSDKYNADIRMLHSEKMDISSAVLRQMVADEQDISHFVPVEVLSYIKAHGLYREVRI